MVFVNERFLKINFFIAVVLITLLLMSSFSIKAGADNNEIEIETSERIELVEGNEITLECGRPFTDPGYKVYDESGKVISREVQVEGTICPWRVGDYLITYSIQGESGKKTSAVRTVHVVPVELPEVVHTHKTIYLTFDDGPSEYTADVLDILDKYNIKATFFIIGSRSGCEEMLPRIAAAGHTIGIHCFKHEYERIYKDENAFFKDFMEAQSVVYRYTGEYAHAARLPGGGRTANLLYYHVDGGYETVRTIMHDMGVRFYDWHIQPESSYHSRTGEIYYFTHPDKPYDGTICLLHDTRDYSVLALEDMIQWALENDYTFLPIDQTTPEVHFVLDEVKEY